MCAENVPGFPLPLSGTGATGGQTLTGGTASGDDLTFRSTSHATKGDIIFGTSKYDEANNRLGIGRSPATYPLEVQGDAYITGNVLGNLIGNLTGKVLSNAQIKIDLTSGKVMQREPTGEWCLLGDKVLTSVCCRSEKEIYGCNSAGEVWKWDGDEWSLLSTSPTMQECSLGADGALCGTKTDKGTVRWDGDSWEAMAGGAAVSTAVLDSTHIYIVGADHTTYGHLWQWNGSDWITLDTTDIDYISVAKDGSLFAILHSDGSLVRWNGSSWDSIGEIGNKAIAAKSATMVWFIASDNTLYYWNGLAGIQSSDDTVSGIALAMI